MNKPGYGLITFTCIFAICVYTPSLVAQTTWHVDDDAPGDPGPGDPNISDPLEDGSADHPFDAIQEGVDASSNGDTVLVADGIYTGTDNRHITFGGKAITVRSVNGPERCVMDCQRDSVGFYFRYSGEGRDSVVQGFTIRNSDGSGIYCIGVSPTITGNIITGGETVSWVGAGICCDDGAFPLISGNIIADNETDWWESVGGGGIACWFASAIIINNVITGNFTEGVGGGIYCIESSGTVIAHNIITKNESMDYGGGIMCESSLVTIKNNIISRNMSRNGGGIASAANEEGSLIINNIILGNEADSGGGLAFPYDIVSQIVQNNLIAGNVAVYGGGIECYWNSDLRFINNTIAGNTASTGGAIYCLDSTLTVKDSILWNIAPYEIHIESGSVTVNYSDMQGGYPGMGNINADPRFVPGPLGSYYLSQISAGQGQDSPCIDAGDGPVGLSISVNPAVFGTTRTDLMPDSGLIDMGYHYPMKGIQIPPGALLEEIMETAWDNRAERVLDFMDQRLKASKKPHQTDGS